MKKVTLYTKPTCPYCNRAKALLDSLNVAYEDHDVEADTALREEMSKKYDWPTVPIIVIGDEFIGGSDALMKLHESGELMKKLEA